MLNGKTGNKKPATYFATLLQNELKSHVARFTTHIKPVLQQIRLLTGLNMGGKTCNIAIQLVLLIVAKQVARFLLSPQPEKTADIWRRCHWFPRQMTSEKRAQKFHADDASLPRSG